MVEIRTRLLKNQAELLSKAALCYDIKISVLEESLTWLKRQEFDEVYQIYQMLKKEWEELKIQKKKLSLLAETMQQICEKYDRTESEIIESGETSRKLSGYVESVNLTQIQMQLSELGFHMTEW